MGFFQRTSVFIVILALVSFFPTSVSSAACTEGAITSACTCGASTRTSGFCCDTNNGDSGVWFRGDYYSSCPSSTDNYRYVKNSGNDALDGKTPATAWKTMDKVNDDILPGQTAIVIGGTYNEQGTFGTSATVRTCGSPAVTLQTDRQGTPTQRITIKGHPDNSRPVIKASGFNSPYPISVKCEEGYCLHRAVCMGSYMTFDYLEVTDSYAGMIGVVQGTIIQDNVVHDTYGPNGENPGGIWLGYTESNNVTIRGNEIYRIFLEENGGGWNPFMGGSNDAAILLYRTYDALVENNKIHDVGQGIFLKVGITRATVRGNVLYNVIGWGIREPCTTWHTDVGYGDITKQRYTGDNNIYENVIYGTSAGHSIILYPGGNGGECSYPTGAPSKNTKIFNNVVYNTLGSGFFMTNWGTSDYFENYKLLNNLFVNLGWSSGAENIAIIYPSGLPGFTSDHNILFDAPSYGDGNEVVRWSSSYYDLAQYKSASGWDPSSKQADPLFLSTDPSSPNFLRLGAGSPAIDAGVIIAGYHCALSDDAGGSSLTGCKHWKGSAPDIGAFESGFAMTPSPSPSIFPSPTPSPSPSITPSPSVTPSPSISPSPTPSPSVSASPSITPSPSVSPTDFDVGFTSSLNKVYFEAPTEFAGAISGGTEIYLAKNEYEAAQMVLFPKKDLNSVTVEVTDLQRAGSSDIIPKSKIELRAVGYVRQSAAKVVGDRIGWIPDPLLPNQALNLKTNILQPYLITVRTEGATREGIYNGNLIVKVGGVAQATLNFKVNVWNFALPNVSKFKSMSMTNWYTPDGMWSGLTTARKLEQMLKIADLGFRNRLPPVGFLANGMDWDCSYRFPTHDAGVFNATRVGFLIDYMISKGANHFFTAFLCNARGNAAAEANVKKYLTDYRNYLNSRGLLGMTYVYNLDEPWDSEVDDVKYLYTYIKNNVGTDVPVMQNTNQNNGAILGTLLNYFDAIDINLGWYGATNSDYYRSTYPSQFRDFWWNVNIWPDVHPNLFLEYPLIDARIFGPMSFKYDIWGFEYWELFSGSWTIGNYSALNSNDLRVYWNVNFRSLDGTLVYPAKNYDVYSSLRMESFRDGIEDADYLYLLQLKDPSHTLLSVPIVTSYSSFTNDPNALLNFRLQVGAALDGSVIPSPSPTPSPSISPSPSITPSPSVCAPTITVDSTYSGYSTAVIDDGIVNAYGGTSTTWASAESSISPHWIELAYCAPRSVNGATIWWAYNSFRSELMTSQEVQVQYWTGSAWATAASIPYPGANQPSSTVTFSPISASRWRLYQPADKGPTTYSAVMWLTEIDLAAAASPSPSITPSPSPSPQPPVILADPTVSSLSTSSATINWNTNPAGNSTVEYGASLSFGQKTGINDNVLSHSVPLSSLSPGTIYYYKITSCNADGCSSASPYNFTTIPLIYNFSLTPAIDSFSASNSIATLTNRSFTLQNTGNQPLFSFSCTADASWVRFYDCSLPLHEGATRQVMAEFNTLGLAPGNYSVKINISNSFAGSRISLVTVAVTSAIASNPAPAITNITSGNITSSSAIIGWNTDINSNSWVYYGTAAGSYGNSAGQEDNLQMHSVPLSSLSPNTYYYYLVSSCNLGNCTNSTEYSFQTLPDVVGPRGCAYGEPPCSSGYICQGNACVPYSPPPQTYYYTTTYTPSPSPSVKASAKPILSPAPSIPVNAQYYEIEQEIESDLYQVSDADKLDIQDLLEQAKELQKQGKTEQALVLLNRARNRLKQTIADSRTTKANFSWQFAVAVLAIIASIAIYYSQKLKAKAVPIAENAGMKADGENK